MPETHSTDFARQLELAWAAGFFDGEGWTCPARNKRDGTCYTQVGIAQVHREPLDRFRQAVGGIGTITGQKSHVNRFGRQPQHRWKVVGAKARQVLDMLWPYLTEVKKRQALEAFAQEVRGAKGWFSSRKTHCPKGHPYAGDNVITYRNGWRKCRACERERDARNRLKLKERRGAGGDNVRDVGTPGS